MGPPVNENHTNELINTLTSIANEVAQGDYRNAGTLFELTKEDKYPSKIVTLAESFGMMIVKIDAKQQHLERLINDLSVKKVELEKVAAQLLRANIGMLEVLGSAIAKRDNDTSAHNYRVTIHAIQLGKTLGLNNAALCSLIKGSFLHDVGKIAISDTILLKPGKLTFEEFEVMKTHVLHGSEIIRNYDWLCDAGDVVLHHHEKFDGTGYPQGLKGDRIPLNARILALADVFDALTSKRPYKDPISIDKTMEIMSADTGSHFDPDLFRVFSEGDEEMYESLARCSESALTERLQTLMRDYYVVELIQRT
jgi:HD-GYP domain-containing protein (c-di-GMP phosphodiesterase class II)